MEQLNYGLLFLAAVFVVATVFLVMNPQGQTINVTTTPDKNRLDVQGTYEGDVSPDKAELTVGIVTNSTTAKEAQDANRVIANAMMDALLAKGLTKKDIETLSYDVHPLKTYNYKTGAYEDHGYEVSNQMKVTTNNLEIVGDLVDAVATAGANEVSNIVFSLTDAKSSQVRTEFLAKAAENGKSKAQAIAQSVGVTLKSPLSVSESFSYTPQYRYNAYSKVAMMEAAAPAPTPISASQVHVTSTVSIGYEMQ